MQTHNSHTTNVAGAIIVLKQKSHPRYNVPTLAARSISSTTPTTTTNTIVSCPSWSVTLFGQARALQTQTTLVSRVFKLISTRFMTPDGFIRAERGVQQQGCTYCVRRRRSPIRNPFSKNTSVDRLRKTIALAAPTPAPKKPSEGKVAFEEVGSLFLIGILFSCRPVLVVVLLVAHSTIQESTPRVAWQS